MSTQRDDKILVHVAPALKAEVQAAAEAEARPMSDFVRRLLIKHFVDNPTERQATA